MNQATDRELAWRIRNHLRGCGIREWSSLQITAAGGNVVLQGSVDSARSWHLCLECCRRVAGVIRVIDELEVALPLEQILTSD